MVDGDGAWGEGVGTDSRGDDDGARGFGVRTCPRSGRAHRGRQGGCCGFALIIIMLRSESLFRSG